MSCSRRQLLQGGAAAALAVAGARPSWADIVSPVVDAGTSDIVADNISDLVDPALLRKLAMEAIGAAKDAGADYADVRLTRHVSQTMYNGTTVMRGGMFEAQYIAVGIRALHGNAWGFASSPLWRSREMPILARSAVEQAKANSIGMRHTVELGKTPSVTGTWTMPVRFDPFKIPTNERIDFMTSWMEFANNVRRGVSHGAMRMSFKRQERALATTDGTFVIQVVYETGGDFPITVTSLDWRRQQNGLYLSADGLDTAGSGWELFLDANLTEQIPRMVERANEQLTLDTKPVEVGRYDLVFDAVSVANLLTTTLGAATELDRALGFEANATGTSYLTPPLDVLKRQTRVASQLVTVSANRSLHGGVATVKWDDEGIEPDTFFLVKQGIVNDFQTTREQAAWLAPWYKSQNLPVRSHGCAASDSAMRISMQHSPNLELAPGTNMIGMEELIADTKRGLAIFGGVPSLDFQLRSGTGGAAVVREIVNGKLGSIVQGAAYQISANSSIWRNLTALGGPRSVERTSAQRAKGEPGQVTTHTVTAVPAKFRNQSVFDALRR